MVEDATNPYTINDLTPETTYEVQVQGINDDLDIATDWTESTMFSTPAVVAVAVGNLGLSTFCCTSAVDFTGVDAIEAYWATVTADGKITFNRIYKVPANTGLLLRNATGAEEAVAAINIASFRTMMRAWRMSLTTPWWVPTKRLPHCLQMVPIHQLHPEQGEWQRGILPRQQPKGACRQGLSAGARFAGSLVVQNQLRRWCDNHHQVCGRFTAARSGLRPAGSPRGSASEGSLHHGWKEDGDSLSF